MEEVITIIDGPENPVGIAKELKEYALQNGRIEQLDKHNKIYIPNDENVVTLVIIDHIGLLKTTKDLSTKKQVIDKMSDELRYARDFFGYSPAVVSQFNRDISNPIRIKNVPSRSGNLTEVNLILSPCFITGSPNVSTSPL